MSVVVIIKEFNVTRKFEAGCTAWDILKELRTCFKCFGGCLVPMSDEGEEEDEMKKAQKVKTDSVQVHIDMILTQGLYQFIDYSKAGEFLELVDARPHKYESTSSEAGWAMNPFAWCFALQETPQSPQRDRAPGVVSSEDVSDDDIHCLEWLEETSLDVLQQEATAYTDTPHSGDENLCDLHTLFEATASDPIWQTVDDEDIYYSELRTCFTCIDTRDTTDVASEDTLKRKIKPDSPSPRAKRAVTDTPARVRFADELVTEEQYLDYSLSPSEIEHCYYTVRQENTFSREYWSEFSRAKTMNLSWAQYMEVDVK